MAKTYGPPVEKLLPLGDPRAEDKWLDYTALGLGQADIPELIRMALDETFDHLDSERPEVWAPLHAWRALGQLRAVEAAAPLLALLRRVDAYDEVDDWAITELPQVLGMIGPAAIPVIQAFLSKRRNSPWVNAMAAEALAEVAKQHPEAREAVIAILAAHLERFATQDPAFNAGLIYELTKLKAVEAAPLMERAFAANRVDLSAMGDWEEVQIELGLLTERRTPARNWRFLAKPEFPEPEPSPAVKPVLVVSHAKKKSDREKARAKRKEAAKMRQRSRKR